MGYLTAKRQTKNLHLLSEIDMLKREINFRANSLEVVGEIVSTNPTKLRLMNKYDDTEIFSSDVTYDANKQFAEISATVNSKKIALSAEYPTTKDFVAAVSTSTDEMMRKEALLNVHLNNSRLLHSRLAWNPNMWSSLTQGMEKSAMSAGVKYVQKWAMINNDIADKVAVNARQRYADLVETSMVEFTDSIYASVASLEALTLRMERALQEYRDHTKKLAHSIHNSVTNGTYVNYAMDKIAEVKNIDISPYVTSFSVPEEYNTVYSNLKETGMSGLTSLWERKELDGVRGKLNSVYQQGAWAYKYWDAELNVKENIEHIMTLLREIVADELKELSTEYRTVYKNP